MELTKPSFRGESGRVRSERFDRAFVPLKHRDPDPVRTALANSVPLDEQSKEKRAEWKRDGIAAKFWSALEGRMMLYFRSFPELAADLNSTALWLSINDLCIDSGDVGGYARHCRFVRVRDLIRRDDI